MHTTTTAAVTTSHSHRLLMTSGTLRTPPPKLASSDLVWRIHRQSEILSNEDGAAFLHVRDEQARCLPGMRPGRPHGFWPDDSGGPEAFAWSYALPPQD